MDENRLAPVVWFGVKLSLWHSLQFVDYRSRIAVPAGLSPAMALSHGILEVGVFNIGDQIGDQGGPWPNLLWLVR